MVFQLKTHLNLLSLSFTSSRSVKSSEMTFMFPMVAFAVDLEMNEEDYFLVSEEKGDNIRFV